MEEQFRNLQNLYTIEAPNGLFWHIDYERLAPDGTWSERNACVPHDIAEAAKAGGIVPDLHALITKRLQSGQLVDRPTPDEVRWEWLRNERDTLLHATDWVDGPRGTYTLSPEQMQAWQLYRQALRDFPENVEDLANPVWPTQPAS